MKRTLVLRSLPVAALLLGAVLALSALVGSAQEGKPLGKVPADLALVPADASGFVTLRIPDLLKQKALLQLLAAGGPGGRGPLEDLERETGIPNATVERITMVLYDFMESPVLVIRTSKPYDKAALLKKWGEHKEEQISGKTVVRMERPRGMEMAWLADASTVVMASQSSEMMRYLARLGKGGKGHALADDLKIADKHSVVVAMRPALLTQRTDQASRDERRFEKRKIRDMKKEFKKEEKKTDIKIEKFEEFKDRKKDEKFEPVGLVFAQKDGKGDQGGKEPPLRDVEEVFDQAGFGGPFLKLYGRARHLLLTADVGAELRGTVRLEYANEDHARDGALGVGIILFWVRETVPVVFREAGLDPKAKESVAIIQTLQAATRAAEVKRDGKVVQASAQTKLDSAAMTKFLGERLIVARDANNLKQIALAFHNYNDTMGHMPAAALTSADGKPLLSWRVAILPYVEQDNLYRQFRLNEAWDSPHNKKLLDQMPAIYAPVKGGAPDPSSTFYQVFTGPNTLYPTLGARPNLGRIRDGTSNTFLVVESARAVPWTKPEDIAIEAKKALPGLGGQFPGYFHAAMCDGWVMQVRRNVDEKTLRVFIDPADGVYIPRSKLRP